MKTIRFARAIMFFVSVFAIGSSNASTITYFFDRDVESANVFGTVTTDGTLGTLEGSNFLGWNLTIDLEDDSTILTIANSQLSIDPLVGLLVATDMNLECLGCLFDIKSLLGESVEADWSIQASGATPIETLKIHRPDRWKFVQKELTANNIIVASVPIPPTVLLFFSGLVGLFGFKNIKGSASLIFDLAVKNKAG